MRFFYFFEPSPIINIKNIQALALDRSQGLVSVHKGCGEDNWVARCWLHSMRTLAQTPALTKMLVMVVHAYNPSTGRQEDSWDPDQLVSQSSTISQLQVHWEILFQWKMWRVHTHVHTHTNTHTHICPPPHTKVDCTFFLLNDKLFYL